MAITRPLFNSFDQGITPKVVVLGSENPQPSDAKFLKELSKTFVRGVTQ